MNRRELLKLLALGVVGHTLDIDKLLWVPGQKKIFLPSGGMSYSRIIAAEIDRIAPYLVTLFERDDMFYAAIKERNTSSISGREITVPLAIRPQRKWEG